MTSTRFSASTSSSAPARSTRRVNCKIGITLNGTDGADVLSGTNDSDTLRGRGGNDRLTGLSCRDQLQGQGGDDRLFGNEDDDRLFGDNGNDRLFGGNNDDLLRGGSGRDQMDGGRKSDRLFGGSGRDQLSGGKGGDTLRGEGGADRLNGGNGNDIIIGGFEEDLLSGGTGRDRFVYSSANEGEDTITDFDTDEDRIDLSRIFNNGNYNTEERFRDYLVVVNDDDNTLIRVDFDGENGDRPFKTLVKLVNTDFDDVERSNFILS